MKRYLYIVLIVLIIFFGLFLLTGCGKDSNDDGSNNEVNIIEDENEVDFDEENNSNSSKIKIEDGNLVRKENLGDRIEQIVYHFTDNTLTKISVTTTYADETVANTRKESLSAFENVYTNVNLEGRVLTYEYTTTRLKEYEGMDRSELKQYLEDGEL